MEKERVLEEVHQLAGQGLITRNELLTAYDTSVQQPELKDFAHQSRLSAILYYIGGIIVFIGIIIFIAQNWNRLNNLTKILATLGSAVAAYVVGVLFSRYEKLGAVSQVFYFISGLIAPLGLYVSFDIAGYDIGTAGMQSFIAAMLFGMYLVSYLRMRKQVFLIFNIVFGTWFYLAFTAYLVRESAYFQTWRVWEYRILTTGLAYMLLAFYYAQSSRLALKTLSRWLYGIGVFIFLGTALMLGGWFPNQNIFWELLFPGLSFGVVFLSIYLKNKSFLVFGASYLMIYILKITAAYFSEGLGWPLALILAGFFLMGVGYLSLYLHKKYISQ